MANSEIDINKENPFLNLMTYFPLLAIIKPLLKKFRQIKVLIITYIMTMISRKDNLG